MSNGVLAQVVCRMVLAMAVSSGKVLLVNKKVYAVKMRNYQLVCYFLLAAFASNSLADDAEFGALPELMEARSDWFADPTELQYVATRCTGMFVALAVYVDGSRNDFRDAFLLKGAALKMIVNELSQVTKMGQRATDERLKFWSKAYLDRFKKNKLIINHLADSIVNADRDFCVTFHDALVSTRKK